MPDTLRRDMDQLVEASENRIRSRIESTNNRHRLVDDLDRLYGSDYQ